MCGYYGDPVKLRLFELVVTQTQKHIPNFCERSRRVRPHKYVLLIRPSDSRLFDSLESKTFPPCLTNENICTKINPSRRNLLRLNSCTLTFRAAKRNREQVELFVCFLFVPLLPCSKSITRYGASNPGWRRSSPVDDHPVIVDAEERGHNGARRCQANIGKRRLLHDIAFLPKSQQDEEQSRAGQGEMRTLFV
jgi:hypothetical protein